MIESLGIPHTEVDLILVNDESVDFSHAVQDGDRVSVYPVFEAFDISPIVRVRPQPLRESRFVLDVHLGRLASYLRILGFDTLYRNDYDDEELAGFSRNDGRILLTRDRGILKRSEVTHGYWVRENRPREQVVGVVRRFDLAGQFTLPGVRSDLLERNTHPAAATVLPRRSPEGTWQAPYWWHRASGQDLDEMKDALRKRTPSWMTTCPLSVITAANLAVALN